VSHLEMADWIDVSVTVRHGMPHWPDNPPIVLERVLDTGRGDDCNVSHLAMGCTAARTWTVRCISFTGPEGWMRCR
jgi:hypothetical protein